MHEENSPLLAPKNDDFFVGSCNFYKGNSSIFGENKIVIVSSYSYARMI